MQEGFKARQEEINTLHKTQRLLKVTLRLKKASDGSQKAQMPDIEVKLLKEERTTLIEEQIMNRKRVADLEKITGYRSNGYKHLE